MKIVIAFALVLAILLLFHPLHSIRTIRNTTSERHPLPNMTSPIEERRLCDHLEQLSGRIGSRSVHEFTKLQAASDYIRQTLEDMGYIPVLQDVHYKGRVFTNIVVTMPGRTQSDEIIVVGAHYDTVFGTPGADDNASAVAVLLELCRMARKLSPDRTLQFVFFTLEEPPVFGSPYMGSRVFARQARERDENIIAMICLEMVGYFSDKKGGQAFPFPFMGLIYSTTPDFIAVVGNLRSRGLVRSVSSGLARHGSIPVERLAAPRVVPGIGLSDHASFWKEGYRAVMITDTAFYRNPNYHRASDTIDTLDFQAMAELTRALRGVIMDLSDAS